MYINYICIPPPHKKENLQYFNLEPERILPYLINTDDFERQQGVS